MPRPSPRTQHTYTNPETGETTTYGGYGTQQLDFVAGKPPEIGTPYQGVTTAPPSFVGFRGFTQSILPPAIFGSPLLNPSVTIASNTGYISPPPEATGAGTTGNGCECEACKNGTGQCSDKNPKCNAWDLACELFGPTDKHGCECEACKNGTGQCSDKVPQCDAWDLACEGTGGATVGVIGGTDYFFWIKIVLVLIGIGVLLWLLRPLFGVAKNITEK